MGATTQTLREMHYLMLHKAWRRGAPIALYALVGLTLLGCKPETTEGPMRGSQKTSAEVPNTAAAKADASSTNHTPPHASSAPTLPSTPIKTPGYVDVEGFEALLVGLDACEVTMQGIEPRCDALKRYTAALRNRGHIERPWHEVDKRLGLKHLLHEDPAVRLQASLLLGPLQTPTEQALDPLIAAARIEVHPGVVKHFIKRLGRGALLHQRATDLMLEFSGHESEAVRLAATDWLTDARARHIPEAIERAMLLAQEDSSARVKQRALSRLGNGGDERVIPLLEEILKTSKATSRRRAAAFRALLTLWSSPVPQAKPSQRAYDASMRWLKKTPRDHHHPPGSTLSAMRWASHRDFKERAPWFDREAFIDTAFLVLEDHNTSPQARTHLADAMTHHAVPVERWRALRERYGPMESLSSAEGRVVQHLNEVVARHPSPKSGVSCRGDNAQHAR